MDSAAYSLLLRDGRDALAAAEWTRARECFETALAEGESAEALAGLGDALNWLGEYDRAAELKERAFAAYRDRGLPEAASEQAVWLAFLHGAVHGNDAAASGWFARAESALEGMTECVQHGWLAFHRAPLTSETQEREQLAVTALGIARRFGDPDLEFDALALLGEAYVQQGRVAEGMKLIDEAMTALSSGEVRGITAIGDIYCRLLSACERATDVRRAEQWMSVVDAFVSRSHSVLVSTTCRLHYGGILVAIGRWAQAEDELLASLHLAESDHRAMRVFPLVRLADLRVRQGRFEEARELLHGSDWHPIARRALATIALAEGELDLARDLARMCVDVHGEDDPACAPLLVLQLDVELARGDLDGARDTADRLRDLAAGSGNAQATAHAELAAGRVLAATGGVGATARLQRAIERFAALELPLEAARARLDLARALVPDGAAAAASEAAAALAAFERLGAARDADAASQIVRGLGGRGRARPRRTGELSTREAEVLSLLAAGLSNAQIAERLFISPRTAEHHVASILSKLGLRSRAEAAAHAVRMASKNP